MATTTVTYDEMRTNAQKLEDTIVKNRVLLGLERLRAEYGDTFAEHIDLYDLDMSDSAFCIVGQLSCVHQPADLDLYRYDYHLGLDSDTEVSYGDLDHAWRVVLGDAEAEGSF